MRSVKYTFWQDGDFFLGFSDEYPDYWTQGYKKEELREQSEGFSCRYRIGRCSLRSELKEKS